MGWAAGLQLDNSMRIPLLEVGIMLNHQHTEVGDSLERLRHKYVRLSRISQSLLSDLDARFPGCTDCSLRHFTPPDG